MKVLLQTVGTGDTVHEALARVLAERTPDLVVHVASKDSADKTLPSLEAYCREAGIAWPSQERWILGDIDDLRKIIGDLRTRIADLRERLGPIELEVDFTSGTKVMSSALVWAGMSERVDAFHYGTGPRGESGSVTVTERIVTLDGAGATAAAALDQASELFNHRRYEAAGELADRQTQHFSADSIDYSRADSLRRISEIYAKWDLFRWSEAFSSLKSSLASTHRRVLEKSGWNMDLLERQRDHLRRCQGDKWGVCRAVDLWRNAERRVDAQQYDDSLSRLYRLIEYLGQCGVSKVLGPAKEGRSPTTRRLAAEIERSAPGFFGRRERKEAVDLGLRDAASFLIEASPDSHLAEYFKRSKLDRPGFPPDGLGPLLEQRNSSWLAHGETPANPVMVKSFLASAREGVVALMHDAQDSSDEIAAAFANTEFARCPWRSPMTPRVQLR